MSGGSAQRPRLRSPAPLFGVEYQRSVTMDGGRASIFAQGYSGSVVSSRIPYRQMLQVGRCGAFSWGGRGQFVGRLVGRTFTGQQSMISTRRVSNRRWMVHYEETGPSRDYRRTQVQKAEPPARSLRTGSDASADIIRTKEYRETVDEYLDQGGPLPDGSMETVMPQAEPMPPSWASARTMRAPCRRGHGAVVERVTTLICG